jgi:hypothetical protein
MRSPADRLGAPILSVLFVALFCPSVVVADTRLVRRGDNLQTALNAARPGDVLVLDAGAEFVGNFVLPLKDGDAPIVVRSAPSDQLPAEGVRIQPSHVPLLARLRSPNTATALRTAPGAHHWELRYLEFAANEGGYGDIIQLGDGSSAQNTLDKVPHHLVLGHLYVRGDRLLGQKRGIALNAAHVTIRDSFIADCKAVGIDSQAIGGWNGPGPHLIENNYLEGAGENVLFGGADPAITGLVASDITFRRNLVSRPLAWRDPIIATPVGVSATPDAGGALPAGSYSYRIVARRSVGQGTTGRSTASAEVSATVGDGGMVRLNWQRVPDATEYRVYGRVAGAEAAFWTVTTNTFIDLGADGTPGAVPTTGGTLWSVKNLFELKNARNVTVEDNVFENHWKESQSGYALLLTPRNSGGACTWCVVQDVRFEHNVVRHVAAGINLLGYDIASRPTRQTSGVVLRNNLFYDISGSYGGGAWFLLIGDEPRDITIDHNTVSHSGTTFIFAYGGTSSDPREMYGVRITNNAVRHATYGINGEFFGYGNGVISAFFPGSTVTANFLAGGSASRYPSGNQTAGAFDAQFVDAAGGDFTLRGDSALRGAATDGGDIGADMGSVVARTQGVETGTPGISIAAPTNLRVVSK